MAAHGKPPHGQAAGHARQKQQPQQQHKQAHQPPHVKHVCRQLVAAADQEAKHLTLGTLAFAGAHSAASLRAQCATARPQLLTVHTPSAAWYRPAVCRRRRTVGAAGRVPRLLCHLHALARRQLREAALGLLSGRFLLFRKRRGRRLPAAVAGRRTPGGAGLCARRRAARRRAGGVAVPLAVWLGRCGAGLGAGLACACVCLQQRLHGLPSAVLASLSLLAAGSCCSMVALLS